MLVFSVGVHTRISHTLYNAEATSINIIRFQGVGPIHTWEVETSGPLRMCRVPELSDSGVNSLRPRAFNDIHDCGLCIAQNVGDSSVNSH